MRKWLCLIAGVTLLSAPASAQTPALLIFGGDGHKEFLGCLNCSEFDTNSIWNDMSHYGWKNSFGIWNSFGPYKNSFSSQSACNQVSNEPPIIVDKEGNSYGYLTLNEFKSGSVCGLQGAGKACATLKVMSDLKNPPPSSIAHVGSFTPGGGFQFGAIVQPSLGA